MKEKPLVNKKFKLQRFNAKGGWTYALISEIPQSKKSPFGSLRVKGSIDDYAFKNYHLMPLGNGKLFLPVNAEIRKRIGKHEGDTVQITLYKDDSPLEIPNELMICLSDEPEAYENFTKLSEAHQKEYINWIYSAKKQETKVKRIAVMINKVMKTQRLNDK